MRNLIRKNTSETHEDALEGASEQEQYRNTSDLSNEVQRANASGNVPQQNLKRREAAFLLGATAFRTREMQKCASPFVEVRQIEFLARETPNYIATNLHISHQWTCESVSGSHLRKRSDEENPQRCYDPSDDRDGTAGFRQHNLS